MIKFFRRIRQKLLSENKFIKYLIYAVGEIVLVVIGILIALQVNNWNQLNQQRAVERVYLSNLLNDLKDQYESIQTQQEQEQSFFEAAGNIIKDYEEDKKLTLNSDFYEQATHIGARRTFIITDPTYTDLISSGNIGVLNNVTFKDKLIKYYQELERIEKIIQNNNSLIVDQIYLSAFQRNGYEVYPNFPSVFGENAEIHEGMILPAYETKLEDISKDILSGDQHLLEYMNAVNLRNTVAIGHFVFLEGTKATTNELIKELEAMVND